MEKILLDSTGVSATVERTRSLSTGTGMREIGRLAAAGRGRTTRGKGRGTCKDVSLLSSSLSPKSVKDARGGDLERFRESETGESYKLSSSLKTGDGGRSKNAAKSEPGLGCKAGGGKARTSTEASEKAVTGEGKGRIGS